MTNTVLLIAFVILITIGWAITFVSDDRYFKRMAEDIDELRVVRRFSKDEKKDVFVVQHHILLDIMQGCETDAWYDVCEFGTEAEALDAMAMIRRDIDGDTVVKEEKS